MSTKVPCILIATEQHHVALDRVLDAQGRGSGSFAYGRRLVAAGTSGPVIARLCQDMSATDDLEGAWRAYAAASDLPEIGGVWGEDETISAAEAQAAAAGLTVHSVAGNVPAVWASSVLAAHGYAFEPEPEV
jgi:hypothetical protein